MINVLKFLNISKLLVVLYFISQHTNMLAFESNDSSVYVSDIEDINASKVALYIEDIHSGDVILDCNGELPMTPASITKIITTASFFQRSDINSKFKTEVLISGNKVDSVLNGNIYIDCYGDPTLCSNHFPKSYSLVDSISSLLSTEGIKRINGNIIVSSASKIDESVPRGWKSNDLTSGYGALYRCINFEGNRLNLKIKKNGEVATTPFTPELKVNIHNCRSNQVDISFTGNKELKVEKGKHATYNDVISNPLPESSLKQWLIEKLTSTGLGINNENISTKKRKKIYTHHSDSIINIIKSMMHRSDNLYAESILQRAFPNKTRQEAVASEISMWTNLGVNTTDVVINDGCGLSRENKVTAYFMADLLAWMYNNDENFESFLQMFPVSGISGTVRSFLKDTPLQGRLRLKTGSLNGVQCYAGYAVDKNDEPTHLVVVMINGFNCSRASVREKISNLLLEKIPTENE